MHCARERHSSLARSTYTRTPRAHACPATGVAPKRIDSALSSCRAETREAEGGKGTSHTHRMHGARAPSLQRASSKNGGHDARRTCRCARRPALSWARSHSSSLSRQAPGGNSAFAGENEKPVTPVAVVFPCSVSVGGILTCLPRSRRPRSCRVPGCLRTYELSQVSYDRVRMQDDV
jgi:hypothetical protein